MERKEYAIAIIIVAIIFTLLENDKEELCSLIDKQMEIERKMLNYGTADFEKDKELYDGFCSLSKDEQLMFQEIKNSIESNIVPPREQILKYINLRAKKYLWVLEKSGQEFSIEFIESHMICKKDSL